MHRRPHPVTATAAALALLAGVLAVQWLPRLPPPRWALVGLLLSIALSCLLRQRYWLAFVLLGLGWATYQGALAMDARLPRQMEGGDFQVIGTVADLPDRRPDAVHFAFDVEQASHAGQTLA